MLEQPSSSARQTRRDGHTSAESGSAPGGSSKPSQRLYKRGGPSRHAGAAIVCVAVLAAALGLAGLSGRGPVPGEIAAAHYTYNVIRQEVARGAARVGAAIRSLDDDWRSVRRLVDRNAQLEAALQAKASQAEVAREALDALSRDHTGVLETQQRLLRDLEAIERDVDRLISPANRSGDGLHRIGYDEGAISPGERALLLRIQSVQGRIEAFRNALSQLETSRKDILDRMSAHAAQQVAEMERIISSIGLDVDALLSATMREEGIGGPFVALAPPPGAGERGTPDIEADENLIRWDRLRGVIETLPIATPLDSFRVGSPFGKRRDPFNRRWAFHQGVDLNAPNRSPVVATAAGEVVFAGWQRNYGRLVEIRHNDLVSTKYAHLARIDVTVGDVVITGQVIGLLGTSGRATGPHLHYEVLVEGEVRDPLSFMGADGRVMQAAEVQ